MAEKCLCMGHTRQFIFEIKSEYFQLKLMTHSRGALLIQLPVLAKYGDSSSLNWGEDKFLTKQRICYQRLALFVETFS